MEVNLFLRDSFMVPFYMMRGNLKCGTVVTRTVTRSLLMEFILRKFHCLRAWIQRITILLLFISIRMRLIRITDIKSVMLIFAHTRQHWAIRQMVLTGRLTMEASPSLTEPLTLTIRCCGIVRRRCTGCLLGLIIAGPRVGLRFVARVT